MYNSNTASLLIRDFVHVFFKRKRSIMIFFFTVLSVVAVGTIMSKPVYEAASKIMVKIGRENLYVPVSGQVNTVIRPDPEEHINSELEILKSTSLVGEVVDTMGAGNIYSQLSDSAENVKRGFLSFLPKSRNINPREAAVTNIQKNMSFESARKSNVIRIAFLHTNPQMAADVVNNFVNLYLERHLNVYKNPVSQKFFQEQARILENKLKKTEETLNAFKKKHGITSVEDEKNILIRQEADLRTSINEILSEQAGTESRIREIRMQLAKIPETVTRGKEVEHNPRSIGDLEARLVELELKEKELLTRYTEQSRFVRNTREEINIVINKLNEEVAKNHGRSIFGPNETYQRLEEELLRNEADLESQKSREKVRIAQLANYRNRLDELGNIEVELNQLRNEVDVDRKNFQLYLAKLEESRISDAMDTERVANVSLIETAKPPVKPVSPNMPFNIFLGILMGAVGAIGFAVLIENVDDRLERVEEVEDRLGLPVLATIPELGA